MTYEECARCGKRINESEIRYVVRLTVVGDDGGVLDEINDPDIEIEKLIEQIENTDPFELESDVMEERVFVLCPGCKKAFLKSPFGYRTGGFTDDDEYIGPMQ